MTEPSRLGPLKSFSHGHQGGQVKYLQRKTYGTFFNPCSIRRLALKFHALTRKALWLPMSASSDSSSNPGETLSKLCGIDQEALAACACSVTTRGGAKASRPAKPKVGTVAVVAAAQFAKMEQLQVMLRNFSGGLQASKVRAAWSLPRCRLHCNLNTSAGQIAHTQPAQWYRMATMTRICISSTQESAKCETKRCLLHPTGQELLRRHVANTPFLQIHATGRILG